MTAGQEDNSRTGRRQQGRKTTAGQEEKSRTNKKTAEQENYILTGNNSRIEQDRSGGQEDRRTGG